MFYGFAFGMPKGSGAQNEEHLLSACLNKKIERLLKITQSFVLRVKTVLTPTQAIKILKHSDHGPTEWTDGQFEAGERLDGRVINAVVRVFTVSTHTYILNRINVNEIKMTTILTIRMTTTTAITTPKCLDAS